MAQGYPMWSGAFWSQNERERRDKRIEEEALMRELAKIAAQAGYEKEIAEMKETGANTRAEKGESGAKDRQMAELALREKLAQDAIQARVDEQGRDFLTRLGAIKTEYGARGDLAEQDWKREAEYRAIRAEIDRRNALATGTTAAANYSKNVGDLDPALLQGLTGIVAGPSANATPKPGSKPGRIKLGGTPPSTKPGETPRSPDNAAPQVPVQVGPKPLSSGASIIGGDKAALTNGPVVAPPSFMELMKQAAPAQPRAADDSPNIGPADSIGAGLLDSIRGNPWGVGPSSKGLQALVEAYLGETNSVSRRPSIKK